MLDRRQTNIQHPKSNMSNRKLQVVPLGGLGEFGMNIIALRYGDDIIVSC